MTVRKGTCTRVRNSAKKGDSNDRGGTGLSKRRFVGGLLFRFSKGAV